MRVAGRMTLVLAVVASLTVPESDVEAATMRASLGWRLARAWDPWLEAVRSDHSFVREVPTE